MNRKAAMAEVREWEEVVSRWEAEAIAAEAEAESIRARRGDELLEDPARMASINAALQLSGETAEAARSAVAAAGPKLREAQLAVIALDEAELRREVGTLRKRLASHRERTGELLALLADHEGEFVRGYSVMADSAGRDVVVEHGLRSDDLETEIRQVELKAAVLAEVLAGGDPATLLRDTSAVNGTIHGLAPHEYYPPGVWGPGALAPVPALAARIAAKRKELADFDEQMATDPAARIAPFEATVARLRSRSSSVHPHEVRDAEASLAAEIRRLDEAPAVRAALVAELEELTGQPDSVDA